jgi:hypothetical protein
MAEKLKPFSGITCYTKKNTAMGFIKNALIGIALYEAVKYFLRNGDRDFDYASEGTQAASATRQQLRNDDIDIIAGARQADNLDRMKENATWQNSLANDDLRAPDS